MSRALISLFAKPPRPGTVKTRLARTIGPQAAAQLAAAFLHDTWTELGKVDADRQLSTTALDPRAFSLGPVPLFDQGGGDLGARIEHTLLTALQTHTIALAVGADVPWMTASRLSHALTVIEQHDAVLGPTLDGGFWCLGVRRLQRGWLAHLPWSQPTTATATLKRLQSHGLRVGLLPTGWDVDDASDLERLRTWLTEQPIAAPTTRRVLTQL